MSKAPGKKSILASFAAYTAPPGPAPEKEQPREPSAPLARVGAGVVGATQRSIAELRAERDELKALVEAGTGRELDPAVIDPSPFPDRLPDDDQTSFESFKALIASEGQIVPILVRPSPGNPDRYQVIYGHRRLRAARELGLNVKATVTEFDDRELAIAQGIENAARQDLSWIEKALFAARMDAAGVKARDIRSALSIDDPELARYRAVCRAIPEDIIQTIGRAPKAGRTRWASFAKACADDAALDRTRETLAAAKVQDSDRRFVLALEAATAKEKPEQTDLALRNSAGRTLGRAQFSRREIKLTIETKEAASFSDFLQNELPSLVERYYAEKDA
ncbi:plasmid partitioning protein RepB [Tianweitania sp. BSSL-BM11]|uniref:Plasmid partitioning protein RepB n=1 Tax=Tianweitania aestuarii TaxID=2814886 RepID=A0ABS5RYP9_9HYPH|nr:plasmid partitioning protein RepB [Tianweitania aestuarii]MBS9722143.1 plasmid partitioning protein RepB [Tianweitania aestuarii]